MLILSVQIMHCFLHCEESRETIWNRYIMQPDTFTAGFISSLSFVIRMDGWMLERYNQVYLLIYWLIKSESRNILIVLISQLPLIITCKMGDVG